MSDFILARAAAWGPPLHTSSLFLTLARTLEIAGATEKANGKEKKKKKRLFIDRPFFPGWLTAELAATEGEKWDEKWPVRYTSGSAFV